MHPETYTALVNDVSLLWKLLRESMTELGKHLFDYFFVITHAVEVLFEYFEPWLLLDGHSLEQIRTLRLQFTHNDLELFVTQISLIAFDRCKSDEEFDQIVFLEFLLLVGLYEEVERYG